MKNSMRVFQKRRRFVAHSLMGAKGASTSADRLAANLENLETSIHWIARARFEKKEKGTRSGTARCGTLSYSRQVDIGKQGINL